MTPPVPNRPVDERPLTVLMVDKFYYVKGGPERYLFELQEMLEAQGHRVVPFAMADEQNRPTPYADCFVDSIDLLPQGFLQKLLRAPRIVARVIYSFHAKRRLERLLARVKPDVAHLHMIDHQISPSILHTLKRHGIPVMQTVHQYKLICPNYRLYIEHKGEICERCLKGHFFHAAVQRCHKHSLGGSLLLSVESTLHRWMKIYDSIKTFHVPSRFMGEKLKQGGIAAGRVHYHFLTLDLASYPYHEGFEPYYLYLGRLSGEKGIKTLIRAVEKLDRTTPCLIVGDGPIRAELEAEVQARGLHQVRFLGYQSGEALKSLIAKAMFVVVPSEWYENSPLVIYEPFALGTPVIGARIGGIPEFITDGETGWLYPSKDVEALTEKMAWMLDNPQAVRDMGQRARRFAEVHFGLEEHAQWLVDLYRNLMEQGGVASEQ